MGKSDPKDKPFQIPKELVWEAYKSVKRNKGAAGVDGQSIEEFEADLKDNLYKIWNRMSSGSYLPSPVRAVEIPKSHGGGTRVLGIPTVADRIAQTVVALWLEPRTESIFHDDSFGYRPGRSPLDAVAKCRERCWKKDWVLDLDVQQFFDSVDHDLMVKAVEANTDQKWVVLYVKRWLKAPIRMPDDRLAERDRGTPQGSAVSPVLANLFLHYAFDLWLEREFPAVEFERFADDAVVHCGTERQAQQVLVALSERLASVGLRLHPDKNGHRVLQGQEAAALLRADVVHVPRVHVPGQESTDPRRKEHVRCVSPGDEYGCPERQGSRGSRVETSPADNLRSSGTCRVDESDHPWLDELLRQVLSDRDVRSPTAHQHLPGALGSAEIQTVEGVQACETLVERAHEARPADVRTLGLDARVLTGQMRRAV